MRNSFIDLPAARRVAALRRRAELLQMQIADAVLVERGGKLPLGEARLARRRHRARVDQQIDLGALEFVDHRAGRSPAHSRW